MKEFVPKLSEELFKTKLEIEKELTEGNKSNEDLYLLILKAIEFLKAKRKGDPIFPKNFLFTNILKINMELQTYF